MFARILCISACVLFVATTASAQTSSSLIPFSNPNKPVLMRMDPAQPAPMQAVRLSLQSASLDLERSIIRWYSNGVLISEGDALKEITIVTPYLGERVEVEAKVSGSEGEGAVTTTIAPVEIDILWSVNSYVHPFYKGRTLAGTNATVRAYALVRFANASGALVPESNIIYTWYRNNTLLESRSGRGKSSISVPGPELFGTDILTVRAESVDKYYSGESSATIKATDPNVLLYENHPLFGVLFHRAIVGPVNTMETEQKVTAVPYFSLTSTPNDSSLLYEWNVNGNGLTPDPNEPQTLTITAQSYTGPAFIELLVSNARDILMRASGEWQLNFGASDSLFTETPLFGE